MLETSISDQKRFVRAEHWRHTRSFLRVRDKVHHRNWRLLTIAGPVPHEEINCIRELMPRAHITSIDTEAANIDAAINAGADEVFHCDISFQKKTRVNEYDNGYSNESTYYEPPECLIGVEPFDAICLDLTGPADDWLSRIVQVYFSSCLVNHGVLMVTFSYGRDVVEVYEAAWHNAINGAHQRFGSTTARWSLRLQGRMPTPVAQRVWYLLGARTQNLDSCLQYRGGQMPMVSCLLRKGAPKPPVVRFEAVEPIDYELAIVAEDVGQVYACPAERIEELRGQHKRRLTAHKAVETRRLRSGGQAQLRLVTPALSNLDQMAQLWESLSGDERAEFWQMLHRQYTSKKNAAMNGPDVTARAALLEDVRRDRESNNG